MIPTRPIWAEISRSRLRHNYLVLRGLAGAHAELLTVVKANAYGHGLAECAATLAAEGANWFGVTSLQEGVELRRICPQARILIMSGIWHGEAETVVEQRLTPVVWEQKHLDWLAQASGQYGRGTEGFPVHLELDTGMSRQGAPLNELDALLRRFGPASLLRLEAFMTHFHSPEQPVPTREQCEKLVVATAAVRVRGLMPSYFSAGSSGNLQGCDTAALVSELAETTGTRRMIRAGLALYGYWPSRDSHPEQQSVLKPALAWKTRVTSLREIEPGTTVGYDATFTAHRRTRVALLPAGYADGLSRLLSNRGDVLIRGRRARIAGRISMDQTMIDVTDIPGAGVGDEVVLVGEQGIDRITAVDVAEQTGTIAYEVLCAIAARVPRLMVE